MRKYWITWTNGIKVGRGKLNMGQLLELSDASVMITAVAVSTPTPTSGGGEWLVSKTIGWYKYHVLY